MIDTVPDILARIVARKREELAARGHLPANYAQLAALNGTKRRNFRAKLLDLRGAGSAEAGTKSMDLVGAGPRDRLVGIIAEIKRASPSKGILSEDFDPVRIAVEYELGGAACLSVLTDRTFFQGSLEDLEMAREAVEIPVLRKDFTLVEDDVLEAAARGADAILLIAAILSERELRDLREAAAVWAMDALVEVHHEDELARAVASGADIIGVNNRNLNNFEVTLETSIRLGERMPSGVLRVSESGIHSRADVERLLGAGYHAFLVGEHLMKASSPAAALRALVAPV